MITEKDIYNLATLQKGWDGYDADPPNIIAIRAAIYFLHILSNRPERIMAHVDGGIAFSWDNIYVEIYNDGDVVSVFDIMNPQTVKAEQEYNLLQLARKIHNAKQV